VLNVKNILAFSILVLSKHIPEVGEVLLAQDIIIMKRIWIPYDDDNE